MHVQRIDARFPRAAWRIETFVVDKVLRYEQVAASTSRATNDRGRLLYRGTAITERIDVGRPGGAVGHTP